MTEVYICAAAVEVSSSSADDFSLEQLMSVETLSSDGMMRSQQLLLIRAQP